MEAITQEEIRQGVREFWNAFTGKSKEKFQGLYSPTARCFGADGRHSEAARLMWVRREREFFGPRSSVRARVGAIQVQILGPNLAVAAYPFHFSIVRVLPNQDPVEVEVPFGRASQVFQRGENGKLFIIHEHLSSAEATVPKSLPADASRRA